MARILLILTFVSCFIAAEAQVCMPDTTIKQTGMYPRNLPDAKATLAYNEVIQFKFPKDTTFNGTRVPIDSVKVTNVKGFPSGFSYQCNKNNRCSYLGGENGCVVIKGNPTEAMVGDYMVKVSATAYVKFGGVSFPAPFEDSLPMRVVTANSIFAKKQPVINIFELKQNYPNPFSQSTTIAFNSPVNQLSTLKVYDILGNEVLRREINVQRGENTITLQRGNMKAGMYFYSMQIGNSVITKRMTVKD